MTIFRTLIMSLMVVLPSSSFFWDDYISRYINDHTLTNDLLHFAAKKGHLEAQKVTLSSLEYPHIEWLKLAFVVGKYDKHIAFQLANYYQTNQQLLQAKIWHQQSLLLNNVESVAPLLTIYHKLNDVEAQAELVAQYPSHPSVLSFSVKQAIAFADKERLLAYLPKVAAEPSLAALYNKLKSYGIYPNINNVTGEMHHLTHQAKLCTASMQLLATNLAGLDHLTLLQQQFKSHALSQYFCLKSPKYVPITSLACLMNKQTAILCDDQSITHLAKHFDADYLALLLPRGGANVYRGVVYLDEQDTVDVFSHELAHLFGFADEYPLKTQHSVCQQHDTDFSLNVVVLQEYYQGNKKELRKKLLKKIPWRDKIKPSTPILKPAIKHNTESEHADLSDTVDLVGSVERWQLGTPISFKHEVGIFHANTCNNSDKKAFKPLFHRTQMEYFETPFPPLYGELIKENQSYLMKPFRHFY